METGRLTIPGRGATLNVAPGFQLIATQRTLPGSSHEQLGSQLRQATARWSRVVLSTLTNDELVQVVWTMGGDDLLYDSVVSSV